MTRRDFGLWTLAFAAGGVGWLALGAPGAPPPSPDPGPPGPSDTVDLLALAAPEVLGLPVDLEPYRTRFRLRLERVPEARSRYLEAAAALDALARERVGMPLQRCGEGPRREVVQAWVHQGGQALDWLRREILEHFSRTEAWIYLGYAAWPGDPDSFEGCGEPLPRSTAAR